MQPAEQAPQRRAPFLSICKIVRFNYDFFVAAAVVIFASRVDAALLAPGVIAHLLFLLAVAIVCATLISLLVS